MEIAYQAFAAAAALFLTVSTVLALIGSHRDGALWTCCAAACAGVVAFFCWAQDHAWKFDAEKARESAVPAKSASSTTPPRQDPKTTKPVKRSAKEAAKQPNSKTPIPLSPLEIMRELSSARPSEADATAKKFEGESVDWQLPLFRVTALDTFNGELFQIAFHIDADPDRVGLVIANASKGLSEKVRWVDSRALVRVRGRITQVSRTNIDVEATALEPVE